MALSFAFARVYLSTKTHIKHASTLIVELLHRSCVDESGNKVGPEGAAALAPALIEIKGLTKLNLGGKCALGHC